MAKSKSLFDDPAAEISELSFVITQVRPSFLLLPFSASQPEVNQAAQDFQRLNEDLDELGHIHELENLSNGQR